MSRLLSLPYILLAFAPLCWAGNLVVGRWVSGEFPPLSISWWRWVVAATLMLLLVRGDLWRQRGLLLRHWKLVFSLSLTGIACFHSAVYVGLTQTTAINGALIVALGPVMIAPLAWLFLGERVTAMQGLGVLLSCVGVGIIVTRGDLAVVRSLAFNQGDLWLLFASFCWATYSVLLKRKPPDLHVLPLLAAILLLGVTLTTPLYLWEISRGLVVPATWQSLGAITYVGVFAGFLAYIAWNRGVNLVGPNRAGLFLHLMPVYAALMAAGFLGESLNVHHLVGFILILGGILVTTRVGGANKLSLVGGQS